MQPKTTFSCTYTQNSVFMPEHEPINTYQVLITKIPFSICSPQKDTTHTNDETRDEGSVFSPGLATTNYRRHHRHGKKLVRSTNRFFRARMRRCHHSNGFMIRCLVLINTHTHTHANQHIHTYIYVAAVAKLAIDHDRERIVG